MSQCMSVHQYRLKTRKNIVMCAIILLVFVMFMFCSLHWTFATPPVTTEPATEGSAQTEQAANDDYADILELITSPNNVGGVFNNMLKVGSLPWVIETFSGGPDGDGLIATVSSRMEVVTNAMSGIVLALITVVCIYAILKEASKGNITMDMWVAIAVKVFLAVAVAIWTMPVIKGIESFANELFAIMVERVEDAPALGEVTVSEEMLSSAAQASVMGLSIFMSIYIRFTAYKLLIELFIRKMFAPIGSVWIITDGLRGPGIRFFKKYLALYLNIIILILSLALAQYMTRAYALQSAVIQFFGANTESPTWTLLDRGLLLSAAIQFGKSGNTLVNEVLGIT